MMKKLVLLFLPGLIAIQSEAQQAVAYIKAGTKIEERFSLYGQTVPISITVNTLTDSVLLNWTIRGLSSGSYQISAAGFEKGTKINFVQPVPLSVVKLGPDETFAIISKAAFKTLKRMRKMVYNNTTYVLKDDNKEKPFTIGGQELDVLHVTGMEEAGDLWILNNPEFPLICQFKNNPLGIDFTVTAIK